MNEKRDNLVKAFMEFAEYNPQFAADAEQVLTTMFLGYKERKRTNKLYTDDASTATSLIGYYYLLNLNEISFDHMRKAFVTKYCTNESKIEGVNDDGHHGTDEIKGLKVMYEYLHSDEIDKIIDTKKLGFGSKRVMIPNISARLDSSALRDALIASTGIELTLLELHRKLYEYSENPDYAYYIRNDDRYLPGTGQDLCTWSNIGFELKMLDIELQRLLKEADNVRNQRNPEALLQYLDDCVVLNCKLIKIHPFQDGNGRTIRAFINKLLENAGLPPIYIKSNERTAYHEAMNKANCDGDYTAIKSFYRYKICDSIIELDINDRVNAMYKAEETIEDKPKTK